MLVVFLKLKRPFSGRDLPDGFELAVKGRNLVALYWRAAFSDLTDVAESSERLWVELGSRILEKHIDAKGVLVCPAPRSEGLQETTYEDAVARYGARGRWLTNVALEPGGRLCAVERAEIPLPSMKGAKPGELYVVGLGRAVRELELAFEPLRVVRLEFTIATPPAKVSAFYAPLLKAKKLELKRRIWSDGSAEQLVAASEEIHAVVHAQVQAQRQTFVQISWVEKA